MPFLGVEIGGTKLQLAVGAGDGALRGLWRGAVDPAAGADGIRRQIAAAVPDLLSEAGLNRADLRGVGVGFGGPVDDRSQSVIKSHQIAGWDDFPLAGWVSDLVGLPAVLGNDADVAGLGEALFGAGKGLSPVFYITIGSGMGGGLVVDGEINRGCGRGAAEIGHLRTANPHTAGEFLALELIASGWGIQNSLQQYAARGADVSVLRRVAEGRPVTVPVISQAAEQGDATCRRVLDEAIRALAEAITSVITLVCPRRIVIGGGVSLLGDRLFAPLRDEVAARVFRPFADLYDIVPAALGEEVVLHGALALARRRFDR